MKDIIKDGKITINDFKVDTTKYPRLSSRSVRKRTNAGKAPVHLKLGILIETKIINYENPNIQNDDPKMAEILYAIRSSLEILQEDDSILDNSEIIVFEKQIPTGNIFKAIDSACELGQKGIAGIIVVADCGMSLTLRAYAESMKIPTMLAQTCECSVEPRAGKHPKNFKVEVDRVER